MLFEILTAIFALFVGCLAYNYNRINLFYLKLKKGLELVNNINQNKLVDNNNEAIIIHNSIQIPYKFKGQNHKVTLPFNQNVNIDHLNIYCYLERNGITEDITHQPGLPYFVTSEHLKADKILLINHDNDKQVEFTSNNVPNHDKLEEDKLEEFD